jgi:hypothetical protein
VSEGNRIRMKLMVRERVMKLMMRERVMKIMMGERLLLMKMQRVTLALISRGLFMMMMVMTMMTIPRWVGVIYLSHHYPVMTIVKHHLLHAQ